MYENGGGLALKGATQSIQLIEGDVWHLTSLQSLEGAIQMTFFPSTSTRQLCLRRNVFSVTQLQNLIIIECDQFHALNLNSISIKVNFFI